MQPWSASFLPQRRLRCVGLRQLVSLVAVVLLLLVASPVLAQVLRPHQEAKVQAWIGQPPPASGLKVGDIAIRPDEIRVHLEATDRPWGKLRLLPLGSQEAPAARLPSFDAVWEGPPPSPALLSWLAQLGEADQGGWWSEGATKPQSLPVRRTAPWPIVLLGPVWLLLAFGMLASALGTRRRRWEPNAVAIALGAGVLSCVLWRSGAVLPGGVQNFSLSSPLAPQALSALWHWQLGGDLAGWRWLAALWTGTLCSGALVAAWNATPWRNWAPYALGVCALVLLLAATSGALVLPVVAGAVWLAVGSWGSASAWLAAACGAILLLGSGPLGVALACAAAVARGLRRHRATRLPV